MADLFRVGIPGDVDLDTNVLMAPVLEEVFDPLPYVEYDFFDTREEVSPSGHASPAPHMPVMTGWRSSPAGAQGTT